MQRQWIFILLVTGLLPIGAETAEDPAYTEARRQLLKEIAVDVRYTRRYLDKAELDPRVLAAVGKVPRHEFVRERDRKHAYENRPLPIGYGQTISQPFVVALMTDLIRPKRHHRVLEVGTGSGYQAAVLSELVAKVYTIEIIEPLGQQAKGRLARLKYHNVTVKIGDGYYGWKQYAPYDAIVVTAAASHVPPALIRQLKPGGRMVIPVGSRFLVQQLLLITKDKHGRVSSRQIIPVMFVPLTGKH